MVQESPSRDMDKVIVRLPDGMRTRIKIASIQNNRSMNAEIVATLEEKYPPRLKRSPEELVLQAEELLADYTHIDPADRTEEDRTTIERLTFVRDLFANKISNNSN